MPQHIKVTKIYHILQFFRQHPDQTDYDIRIGQRVPSHEISDQNQCCFALGNGRPFMPFHKNKLNTAFGLKDPRGIGKTPFEIGAPGSRD